jgi:hypothetical protein
MTTTEVERPSVRKTATKTSWLKSGTHTITTYTGHVIKIKYPNLALMMRIGLIPTHLRATAVKVAKGEVTTSGAAALGVGEDLAEPEGDEAYEEILRVVELMDLLIAEMVVEPKLSQEDIDAMPGEDRDLLLAIANRERDVDAAGVRLGVEPLSRWDTFRERHHCTEDCRSCKEVRQFYSSVDLGVL